MRYDLISMLPERAFQKIGGHTTYEGGKNDAPPPPDYGPMARASERAADLGYQLGTRQLDEAQRQYGLNSAAARPIVDAQLALMNQQQRQGDDYYNYNLNTFRPLEQSMVANANNEASAGRMEEQAGQAAADVRAGQSQQANMMARQGLRYGYSPERMASMAGSQAAANAGQVAGAMTGARNQQRNLGFARQMDAAGLGRGLAGASQGAYGMVLNSGNSALNNQMQPGNALMTGMAQGAGMQQQGVGQQMTGLGGILNAQGSYNNMVAQNNAQGGGFGGALLGAGAQLGSAYLMRSSDRRLKENIVPVGRDILTQLPLYEFNYKTLPEHRYCGVMADEVVMVFPDAVDYDSNGFARVNYGMLGMEMKEIHHGV